MLRGLPPRALVPELGDNGDCVLHEGYRCVLAQRRRPLSAGCRRHRLLRRWARDGAGMDIGQALLRIPTVETGGKMLFGRALSRLRRPTVRNAGAWRQPHRISSTSKSSSFLATKRPPGAVRRATAWRAAAVGPAYASSVAAAFSTPALPRPPQHMSSPQLAQRPSADLFSRLTCLVH